MAGLTLDLTSAKKKEIQKTVKDLMRKKGLDYEDWLAQQELNYLLDNIADAITPKTNYANKRGE
ncbi:MULTISPECIES: hypothetical protein [Enterococcus]|uniref:Uncharacterized protein n=1 Tax=Enterococcus gallinarum TaxID=1353 RepID=A0ABD4ZXB2_ENTGA|nr:MULTISPECIES: hypothetical protein [Enterococcus]MBF0825260.1 hypothetical protein [Enterococcus faecalis]MBF0726934.1 hypothetical protein [Enterococcus gallinarum]MBF0798905.1 hypothetical protein [Enterococcus gallinarum]MBX8979373.1 hypothetical protein [Enterococcus gallinarum]MCO5478026.1 hypothetical protein [Enterococcus gallinarum]